MALVFLGVAVFAVALRAVAAAGSATLYAPVAPRSAASLEAAAAAAGMLAAGATGLALLESTGGRLAERGFRVLRHQRVPPNDGGISYGQAAVAAARLRSATSRP